MEARGGMSKQGGSVETGLRTEAPHGLSLQQRVYLWLAGIFVTSLLVADITGAKFFHFGEVPLLGYSVALEHSVGMFAFPVTFLLTDLVNEYYGSKGARRITFLGLGMAAYAFVLIYLARLAPPAPAGRTFVEEEHFQSVFAMSNRLYVASLTAHLVGQMSDIGMFWVFKKLTKGRMLWLRATGSTVVSQALDSLTISFVLGYGTALASGEKATTGFILETAAKGYGLKFAIAVGITPLIYVGHGVMKKWFGLRPVRLG